MALERRSSTFTSPAEFSTWEICNISEKLAQMPSVDEKKFQRLKPAAKGTYGYNTALFLETYLAENSLEKQTTTWNGVTLVGNVAYHDIVIDEITEDRDRIEQAAKLKVKDVFIFLGSGLPMNTLYRAIGASYEQSPNLYPRAIAGGNSSFLNIDEYRATGCFYSIYQVGSRRHEFRHAAIDSVLDRKTGFMNTSRINRTVHEALGGPDEFFWKRTPTSRIRANFDGLPGNNFFKWLADEEDKIGYTGGFFESPIVKSFYLDLVYTHGGFEDWFNFAVELGKKEKLK